jgi:queuosine precursor transporter
MPASDSEVVAAAPTQPMSVQQRLYVWLAVFSATCLIVADVVGIKLFHFPLGFTISLPVVGPISAIDHTCGMLTFPVTFILTDLINEYYGKKAARRVAYIGMAMALFVFAVINIAQAMPFLDAPYNVKQEHFDAILGSAKVMYIASVTAYIIGQLCDIWVFHLLKRVTRGRLLWLRATGSTVISQLIDSFVVSYIAFSLGRQLFGSPDAVPAPMGEILKIAATGYILKLLVAIGTTPLIYAGHAVMHRVLGLAPLGADDPRA